MSERITKVWIEEGCISCKLCQDLAPAVFLVEDDQVCVVKPEAAGHFETAYKIVGDPVLLFNIAQAYEKAGALNRAIVNYEAYVERAKSAEDRADVQVKIAGQGSYAFVPEDLPLVVTLILGDDLAGRDGACGRYAFNGGSCRASRGGSRLSCR